MLLIAWSECRIRLPIPATRTPGISGWFSFSPARMCREDSPIISRHLFDGQTAKPVFAEGLKIEAIRLLLDIGNGIENVP